jgi:ferrochelatase
MWIVGEQGQPAGGPLAIDDPYIGPDAWRRRVGQHGGQPVERQVGQRRHGGRRSGRLAGPQIVELGRCQALREAGAQRILVLPLFPQYSGTTNAATWDQVGEALRTWRHVPELHLLPDYCKDTRYITALADSVRAFRAQKGSGEHLLMTFHGIPKSYVDQGDPYRRKCELTARALAAELALPDDAWSISFQSRVGTAEWLRPYTDDVIVNLAGRGIRQLDAICPGFAVDCLETIDEIGHECDEAFRAAGGGELRYIPALNAGAGQVGLIGSLLQPLL